MNKVIILGRITKDIELRQTQNGKSVSSFTVAVNRGKDMPSDFINCVAFNKAAEIISQYFGKGSQILIEGNIKTGSYEAQDGSKRYTTDVWVERFDFVDSKKIEKTEEKPSYENDMEMVDGDSDIPF